MEKQIKNDIIPKFFKLQWHITERCNFRCKHCYQENYNTPEMSLNEMEEALRQYVDLVKKWELPPRRADITITGGEPFLYKDFYQFLAKIYKYSRNYHWGILSNGSLVNRENIKILKLFRISSYQVSLEGLERNNDEIRGKGNFKKAIESIKTLIKEGVSTVVSLTINKNNLEDIPFMAKLFAKMGVEIFWVRRLVPWGEGSQLTDLLLEPGELLALYRKIEKIGHNLSEKGMTLKIIPACENSFLWPKPEQKGWYCSVLRGEIFVLMPNGDVYPCRRLPINLGNILKSPLEEIYYSDKIKEIRDLKNAPQYCRENCSDFKNCFGGAKCVTYAYSGRLDIPDIQCPRAYQSLDKNLNNK